MYFRLKKVCFPVFLVMILFAAVSSQIVLPVDAHMHVSHLPEGRLDQQSIFFADLTARVFHKPNPDLNHLPFDITPGMPEVFQQQNLPGISFDPLYLSMLSCNNTTGVTYGTNPFTDVTPGSSGGDCVATVLQDSATHEVAGIGDLENFEVVFTGGLYVPRPGNVTFTIYNDDTQILSIGPEVLKQLQPTRVSGPLANEPVDMKGPFTGYPVVEARNDTAVPTPFTSVVNFPDSGFYPIELDYSEYLTGRTLVVIPSES